MTNLDAVELKVFVPSKDFMQSKQFYQDIGFTKASDADGIAYFYTGTCSFLLQDFYDKTLAENLMLHLLVEDVYAWHQKIAHADVVSQYDIKLSDVQKQPWHMLDFTFHDPSGVLWRVGQNNQPLD